MAIFNSYVSVPEGTTNYNVTYSITPTNANKDGPLVSVVLKQAPHPNNSTSTSCDQ
jgi:hypothetical protein